VFSSTLKYSITGLLFYLQNRRLESRSIFVRSSKQSLLGSSLTDEAYTLPAYQVLRNSRPELRLPTIKLLFRVATCPRGSRSSDQPEEERIRQKQALQQAETEPLEPEKHLEESNYNNNPIPFSASGLVAKKRKKDRRLDYCQDHGRPRSTTSKIKGEQELGFQNQLEELGRSLIKKGMNY